jgi:trehalose 6-phosphate phosphatase
LFLDVDGTLLDIARHPAAVNVDPWLARDLHELRRHLAGAMALLSGRPLSQLDSLFAWSQYAAAGLHGTELRVPNGDTRVSTHDTAFAQIRARARALTASVPGVLLEDKRLALALHYRHAPAAHQTAEQIAHELLLKAGRGYAIQRGDHVLELKPADANKGRALASLMSMTPFRGRTPWMLGDDLTDEDAFQRVNALGGVSVIVGARRPTTARHALRAPSEVRAWLHARVVAGHV